jgi:predicted nucleic acid-binding protein
MAVIIDASVAIGWLVRTQATPLTRAALVVVARETGWIPAHFAIEVARTLRNHERRRLLTPAFVDEALGLLRTQRLRHDPADPVQLVEMIVALARRHALRVADAAYLELALRLGLPLATRDAALGRAASAAGIALFTA